MTSPKSTLHTCLMLLYSLFLHIAIGVSLIAFFEDLSTSHYYPALSLGSILRSDTVFLCFFAAFVAFALLGTIVFAFSKDKYELVTSFVKTFIPTVVWSDAVFILALLMFL